MKNYKEILENINFKKGNGLVPAIIQDFKTLNVLMLGYMNQTAFEKTIATRQVTFFSRSKQRLWTKGETSGNFLNLVDIKLDCDQDALLVKVKPVGVVCHTGSETCFEDKNEGIGFLNQLAETIQSRKKTPKEGSYTTSLFQRGVNKIAQKVGEEAVELVIEAKDNNDELFKNECADLLFHLLVLLEYKEIPLTEVIKVLESRNS